MENKKIFIGNLDFNVTEDDVKNLLLKYGTVVTIKMHQKKGYAFVEMGDAAEASKVIQKLDGTRYKDREIRASLEMKAGKAKSVSVKKYKERGKSFSKGNQGGDPDTRPRSEKYRDTVNSKSGDRGKPSGSSYGKPKSEFRSNDRSSGFEKRTSGEERKERPGLPRPERDRWATERPEDSHRPAKRIRAEDNPSYSSRPERDEKRAYQGRSPRPGGNFRSSERSAEKSSDRSAGTGNRPVRDYTKESSWDFKAPKREWTPEKPSYSGRPSRDGERSNSGRSSKPEARTRSGERSSSPRPPKREWTPEKPSGSSNKISDSWREKPEKKEFSGERSREYSRPKSVSGTQNRITRTSRPKSGENGRKSPAGSSRPKPRSGSGDRDRSSRPKRD